MRDTTERKHLSIFSSAFRAVLDERERQIEAEGWTPEHDDKHDEGEMALAAAAYAAFAAAPLIERALFKAVGDTPSNWPWDREWWKPKSPRADLVRAGALILAEIERLDRAAKREAEAAETAGDIIIAEWANVYRAVALAEAPHCPACHMPRLLSARDECFDVLRCDTCGASWRVAAAGPAHDDLDRLLAEAEVEQAASEVATFGDSVFRWAKLEKVAPPPVDLTPAVRRAMDNWFRDMQALAAKDAS